MLTRYIYLIRHGRYVLDKDSTDYGHLDSLGIRQAQAVGRWMRQHRFDNVYTSPLPRAIETGELACAESGVRKETKRIRDLRECIPTVPEKFADDVDWQRYKRPGRLKEKQARLARVYERIAKRPRERDRHDIYFAHGNVIRYLCCLALECDPDAWINMHINHGSFTCISVSQQGRVKRVGFNSVEHLAPTLRTS